MKLKVGVKMKNKKGFTLVELLAMLVVLGIIMGIAVPNVMGMIGQNRINHIKADAQKMVDSTKIKMTTNKYLPKLTNDNDCLVFSLKYLNSNEDITTGPNGGTYLEYESLVTVKKDSGQYKYYVRLIEEKDSTYYGYSSNEITSIMDDSDKPGAVEVKGVEYATTAGDDALNDSVDGVGCSNIIGFVKNTVRTCKYFQGIYYDNEGNPSTKEDCEESCGGEGTCPA